MWLPRHKIASILWKKRDRAILFKFLIYRLLNQAIFKKFPLLKWKVVIELMFRDSDTRLVLSLTRHLKVIFKTCDLWHESLNVCSHMHNLPLEDMQPQLFRKTVKYKFACISYTMQDGSLSVCSHMPDLQSTVRDFVNVSNPQIILK